MTSRQSPTAPLDYEGATVQWLNGKIMSVQRVAACSLRVWMGLANHSPSVIVQRAVFLVTEQLRIWSYSRECNGLLIFSTRITCVGR